MRQVNPMSNKACMRLQDWFVFILVNYKHNKHKALSAEVFEMFGA